QSSQSANQIRMDWLRLQRESPEHWRLISDLFNEPVAWDFGPLTGLALAEPLNFEYDDNLRFQYLMEFGRVGDGNLVSEMIRRVDDDRFSAETLMAVEQERDKLVDEISLIRGELDIWRRRTGWKPGDEVPDFVQAGENEIRGMEQSLNSERFQILPKA